MAIHHQNRGLLILALGAVASIAGGCQNPIPAGGGVGQPDSANPGGAVAGAPIVNFSSPVQSMDLMDSGTTAVQYRVISNRPTTVKLFLDADLDTGNNNEMDVAPIRSYVEGNPTDQVDLVASRYPYGTYWIRAVVSDGEKQAAYLAPGTVRIVPSAVNPGEDPGASDLTGLQVLFDAGPPVPVNGAIPFVDLWWELDPLDNLAPRVIMPVEFTEAVEIHKLQAFSYGTPESRPRRVDIYQGTDESGMGTLVGRVDASMSSHFSGRWITMTFDPPLQLEPGQYGVAYHARYEFTERVAGNSPNGAGYVWVSAFDGAPFQKVDSTAFGFGANFAIRVFGLVQNKSAAAAKTRIPSVLGPAPRLRYRNGDERAAFEPDQDISRELLPLHISWREALPAAE